MSLSLSSPVAEFSFADGAQAGLNMKTLRLADRARSEHVTGCSMSISRTTRIVINEFAFGFTVS
jgi:hypothetical protein